MQISSARGKIRKASDELANTQKPGPITFTATTREYTFDEFQIIQRELEMNDLRKAINANKREMKANKKRYEQLQAQGKAQREDLLESD